ncbi:hypothetical protein SNE40_021220 [Patella caerulea]|uniref:DDE-1 domain-containing protein n=1 Tax=Patella caerulea TaxID=87958 RepID=A0AAN8GAT1_PATCE
MLEYVEKVLIPSIDEIKDQMDLPVRQRALVICDVFRAHRCASVIDALTNARIEHVFVPAGCTGELQPMDLSVNGDFKKIMKDQFTEWYADQIAKDNTKTVELKLSTMKPLHARWTIQAFDKIKEIKDTVLLGWKKSGLL